MSKVALGIVFVVVLERDPGKDNRIPVRDDNARIGVNAKQCSDGIAKQWSGARGKDWVEKHWDV